MMRMLVCLFAIFYYSTKFCFANYDFPQIVGGAEVDPKKTDTSYIVSFTGGCAGSIIAEKWILTAAHCEKIFADGITGGNVKLNPRHRITLKMKKYYLHPGFMKMEWGSINDFALIELEKPIDFKVQKKLGKIERLSPAQENDGLINEGVIVSVYGWGAKREGGWGADTLMEINIPIVSRERANISYEGKIDQTMIAAGLDTGGKDSCQGDSGSPMVVFDQASKKSILAGLVSFGHGCARPKFYGIYSNVASANNWINEIMKQSK